MTLKQLQKPMRIRHNHYHSKKATTPVSTESDIFPLGKRVKVLENSYSQLDNSSYFGGLLNTSSTNDSNILHSILTLNKKISPTA